MEVKEFGSINMSVPQKWRELNNSRKENQSSEQFGRKYTFEEEEKLMSFYAKAYSAFNNIENNSVTICALSTADIIQMVYGLSDIGIRTNFISNSILKNKPEFLDALDADTLILLDVFVPQVLESVAKSRVKNVIITSLADGSGNKVSKKVGAPKAMLSLKKTQAVAACKKLLEPLGKTVIDSKDFLKAGRLDKRKIESVYEPNKTMYVLYTGGSTGIPKGVEISSEAINRNASTYIPLKFDVRVGDRNGVFIPLNHPTSWIQCIAVPWNYGTVQVYQPIYNRLTFSKDIIDFNLQIVMGAPSHYMTLQKSDLPDDSLSHLRWDFSGGEAVPYYLAQKINDALERLGVQNAYLGLGYGMSELASMAIYTPGVEGLVNKVGRPIPGVECRIRDRITGEILEGSDVKGLLEVKSAMMMNGYWKNPELTASVYTDDGFMKSLDIATRDENGFYDVRGRADDSFAAQDGSIVDLFELEILMYEIGSDYVLEAEAVKLPIEGSETCIPVIHLVLQPEYVGKEAEIIIKLTKACRERLEKCEMPEGFKIRTDFATNEVSAKRDYVILKKERDHYYRSDKNDKLFEVSFNNNGKVTRRAIAPSDVIIATPLG